jgi:hypothetical protein
MKASDWLILVIDFATKPLQPVQLQKSLFLLDKKLAPHQKGVDRIYTFTPYDFGPFDSSVYSDAEFLAEQGLVVIERRPGQNYKQYQITKSGHAVAASLSEQLEPGVLQFARDIVKWCQGLTFNQLVSTIYREYPEMKEKSVFKGAVH